MTAETRQRIRQLIDQHRRAHLDAYRRARPLNYCKGCGGNLADRTPGCPNCSDRARRVIRTEYERRRRLERAQAENKAYRLERRRAGLCSRCDRPIHDHTPVAKSECIRCWDRQRYRRRRREAQHGVD